MIDRIFTVIRVKCAVTCHGGGGNEGKDFDKYLKLVNQTIDKIAPAIKYYSAVPNEDIRKLLDEIREKGLEKSWLQCYILFAHQISDIKTSAEKDMRWLFSLGRYELCFKMLTHEAFDSSELALFTIQLCRDSESNEAFSMAEQICIRSGLHEEAREMRSLKKRLKSKILIMKDKWQIAVEIARSETHKHDVFQLLLETKRYREAQLAYDIMQLGEYGIPPVSLSQTELNSQASEVQCKYLSLPVPSDRIFVIDSLESLVFAEERLRGTLFACADEALFVGVDCELDSTHILSILYYTF